MFVSVCFRKKEKRTIEIEIIKCTLPEGFLLDENHGYVTGQMIADAEPEIDIRSLKPNVWNQMHRRTMRKDTKT